MNVLLFLGLVPAAEPVPAFAGRPLTEWVKDLAAEDLLVREEAVEVLADAGPAARAAAPALEKLAREGPPALRLRAALALRRVAGKNALAVELLAQGLRLAPSAEARVQALTTLQQLSADAEPAVPAVLEWVDAAEPAVRGQALNVLRAIGPAAVPAVFEGLENKDVRRRRRAALALGSISHLVRDRTPVLRRRLADEDLAVRAACARILWGFADTSKPVQEALADAVANGDADLRRETFTAATSILDSLRTPAVRPIVEGAIKDPDLGLRLRAAEVLFRIDGKAEPVLPVFLEGLRSKDNALRTQALAGLSTLGPKAAPAVPVLIERLQATAEYDFQLAQTLARIGPAAAGPLVDLLTSPNADPALVQAVTNVLNTMGPAAASKVLPLIGHASPQVRRMACQVIGNSGTPPATAVGPLIERLGDTDAEVRRQALAALGRFGPAASAAVPKVIGFCKDPQPAVRSVGLYTLEAIGAQDPAVVPVALAALKDEVVMVRAHGLLLLSAANPDHPDLVPEAVRLIKDQPPNLLGLNVLQRVGPGAGKAVPALVEWLRTEPAPGTRNAIAFTLGRIGPAARAAVPDLVDLLRDRDPAARRTLLEAVRSIGGADHRKLVPVLLGLVRDNQDTVLDVALNLLGEQGPAAAEAVPILLDELRKPQGGRYLDAARALAGIAPERARKEGVPLVEKLLQEGPNQVFGARVTCLLDPDHKEATKILRRALRDRNPGSWYTRKEAAEAVADVGPAFRDAAPELEDVLEDKNPDVRLSAAWATWRAARDVDAAVPVLVDLLEPSKPIAVRHQAMRRLKDLGPAAKEARSALRQMRTDPDPYLRQLAAEIVRRIDSAMRKSE